ncbi:MAG TPA: DNRLRE domain-containing protein [Anaerolineales bacterium]|nr:DNRLRE domain-containing protein [Anaerolineales bacterium]
MISTLFLIITVSPLISCVPSNTPPVGSTATAVGLASPTPTFLPSVTASPATPTGTQVSPDTPLTFIAEADAWVDESNPDENNGSGATLRTDGQSDPDIESFIRFTVTGISGTVQSARFRVYAAANDSRDGPAVYMSNPAWEESEITWNTRPARISNAIDNKDRINSQTWVEYNVTSQVGENGRFSFVLVADSSDGIAFSSREGDFPPELVITLGSDSPSTPTPPLPAGAEVFVGAGDIASCDNDNDDDEMTAQLLDAIPGTVFTTGDNAYSDGTYAEYMDCYEPTWGRHKERTRPVPGSHDYHTPGAAGYFQYFDNIPEYYAYDLGAWRIYAMNSEIDISPNGPQVTWLQSDLAENPSECVLAYWHRPRWSSGVEHGRDPTVQTLWEVLYDAGAELVLNGHEHNYERFMPMDARGEPDPLGVREFVVGTGGADLYSFDTPLPTSEVRDSSTSGVLKLILRETGYDWQFIPVVGSTFTDSGSAECH